jgi:hypothetical protein
VIKFIKVRFTVINLRKFDEIIETPVDMELKDKSNILDFIMEVDKLYYERLKSVPDDRIGKVGFHDDNLKTLLHMMWDPKTGMFYDDVGVGVRSPPPEYKFIPIREDQTIIMPDGSNITLTPLGET